MSLVSKLLGKTVCQASGDEKPVEKKESKPSLVNRLATIHQTGQDPVPPPPVNKKATKVNKEAPKVNKGASLVNKLASEFAHLPLPIGRVAEVRFENMEAAQKAVTKLYEQTDKVLDDLKVTGQDLRSNNLELAAGKVLDMAQTIQTIKESFESEFPHLMKFTSDSSSEEEVPAEPQQPPQEAPQQPQQTQEAPEGAFGGGAFEAPQQQQQQAPQQPAQPQQPRGR